MSEVNKKCFISLVFGVALLCTGYYLGPRSVISRLSLSLDLSPVATGKRDLSASTFKLKHQAQHNGLSHNHSLPQDVIDGVKTFVFFMGYSRSGSSIISSLMDAHPHMVVAYQYKVINSLKSGNQLLTNKAYLYEELYKRSRNDSTEGWRSEHNVDKGYTLHIGTGWQGKYDKYVSVIGDKTADKTVNLFAHSPSLFSEAYTKLQETVGVPVKAIFVVRNPYDIISTRILYSDDFKEEFNANSTNEQSSGNVMPAATFKLHMKRIKESGDEKAYEDAKYRAKNIMIVQIRRVARQAKAISGMIDLIGRENVWQVHSMDLVNNPKAIISEMCGFFNVHCSADYIKTCVDSIFKSVSKTRELVYWPQTEKQIVMDSIIKAYPFFHRYSFDRD